MLSLPLNLEKDQLGGSLPNSDCLGYSSSPQCLAYSFPAVQIKKINIEKSVRRTLFGCQENKSCFSWQPSPA